MKNVFLSTIVLLSVGSMAACPESLLVKKLGAKSYYSQDLSVSYNQKELNKFGCSPKQVVMTKNQKITLIEREAKKKIERINSI